MSRSRLGAPRPPCVPKRTQILPGAGREASQVRRLEKSANAKENRFNFVRPGAERFQRQPLREEGERELVLFVAERRGDLLIERFILAMQFGQPLQPLHFALEAELRSRIENAANFFLRQSAERRMTATRLAPAAAGPKDRRARSPDRPALAGPRRFVVVRVKNFRPPAVTKTCRTIPSKAGLVAWPCVSQF